MKAERFPRKATQDPDMQFSTTASSRWRRGCLAVAAVSLVTATIVFWRGMTNAEQAHIDRLTSQAATTVMVDLRADLSDRISALQLLARSPIGATPASVHQWHALAAFYLAQFPSACAVELIDPQSQVRDSATAENAIGRCGILDSSAFRSILELAARQRAPAASPVEFLQSGKEILGLAAPACQGDQCSGFVLAQFDAQTLLDESLDDVSGLGYGIVISENGRQLYSRPSFVPTNERPRIAVTELPLLERSWSVQTWPRPELISDLSTPFAQIALFSGLALASLMLVSLYLAFIANERARQVACSNIQRKDAIRTLRQSEARFAGVLEMSTDAIISTDQNGRLILFNKSAETIFGYRANEVLEQSIELLLPEHFGKAWRGKATQANDTDVHRDSFLADPVVTGIHKDGTRISFEASVSNLEFNGEKVYTFFLRDITERLRAQEELKRAHDELEGRVALRTAELARSNEALAAEIGERKQVEETLRRLSGRLLQLQDEERRRMARELHDSTAQYLAALTLNIGNALGQGRGLPEAIQTALAEAMILAEQCSSEIRTMSYLLHPPLLDDFGLISALQWYAAGFSKRSGVQVQLRTSSDIDRLPADIERTFFRIVQECLTNIRRHSGADEAFIRLLREGDQVRLEVVDNGKGIPRFACDLAEGRVLLGVGIAGMRERVHQLNGRFEVEARPKGTIIRATLPLSRETASGSLSLNSTSLDANPRSIQ